MSRKICASVLLFFALFGCEKKAPTAVEVTPSGEISDEPVQKLARDAAQKIKAVLNNGQSSTVEILSIDGRDIFPPAAFSYFENALTAQLAAIGIQTASSDWQLKGDLSKQEGNIVLAFQIYRKGEIIRSDSVRIPDDQRLQNTLAQFGIQEKPHDHITHKEMPVPTPLAELFQIPLDIAENCPGDENCSLLLLYSNELVIRNWEKGTERSIPLPATGTRSRAPSGKIIQTETVIFIVSNQFATPFVVDRHLKPAEGKLPARLPSPEPGLNTYALAEGRFFDFEEFGPKGLAVIDLRNRLLIAEQGSLVSADEPVGGTLRVSFPYIYTSSPSLPGQNSDSILKFSYKDGRLQLDKNQNMDGSVHDITITDLNRDQKFEMLVTVRNARGIFIEVYEPF